MRNVLRIVRALPATLLLLAVTALCAAATDVTIYNPKSLPVPPIGKIPAVKPERFVLPNGVVVYLLENHDLPVVEGTSYLPSAPDLAPAGRTGLLSLTGDVMRSGGTAAHSGDWLDDRLSAIGASIDANISNTLANAGFRCLTDNTSEVVGLWAELLRAPVFPDDKIELAKVGLRREIAGRNDEMMTMLFRTASQAIYGPDSPWGRQPEYATIEPIAKADCQQLHARVFVPERMIVAIYGDFRAADMKRLLLAKLGDWKKSATARPVLPPTPTSVKPKLFFAPKEDVTQSGVVIAQPGSRADDPDYAPMQVLEQGLGGGMASRLMNHIRTQRGLAYTAGARAGSDFARPGVFMAYTLTKSESTMVALGLLRDDVRAVTQAPFTEAELQVAKQAVVNGFVFNFEAPSQTLFRAAYYEAVGYPADFLQRYQSALDGVTAQTVLAAAQRKVTPDAQVVIVVGKEKDFAQPLTSAGLSVERVDITIPPPASKLGAVSATPEAKEQGRAWLQAAAKAAGGSPAWAAVHSIIEASEATVSMQGQNIALTIEESWRFPDHRVGTQKLPFGEFKQGFDGKVGWQAGMGKIEDDPKAAAGNAREWERSPWRLFSEPAKVELVALDHDETIDGVSYHAAAMTGSLTTDLLVLFTTDGKFAGVEYQSEGQGQQAPAHVVELYTNWSAEGALQYPHGMKVLHDGTPFVEAKITSLKLNPVLADALFAKPAK